MFHIPRYYIQEYGILIKASYCAIEPNESPTLATTVMPLFQRRTATAFEGLPKTSFTSSGPSINDHLHTILKVILWDIVAIYLHDFITNAKYINPCWVRPTSGCCSLLWSIRSFHGYTTPEDGFPNFASRIISIGLRDRTSCSVTTTLLVPLRLLVHIVVLDRYIDPPLLLNIFCVWCHEGNGYFQRRGMEQYPNA